MSSQELPVKSFSRAILLLCLCVWYRPAEAAKLTITTDGTVSGAVGVIAPGSNVCNPNPGGGAGGGTCVFDYPAGTFLRVSADAPNTPGFFSDGTGDAAACATSTCSFVINQDSFIKATFGIVPGPYASITMVLGGAGKGAVRTDNDTCQNWELNFSACTIYYAPGSLVTLEGDSVAGNIFDGFSGAAGDA
ncbi:MAG TPA: hypothetical protein VKI43_17120, partial [Vicinamibacterales bacterium]|nr:hypothetical protein [Vicinamibacterales bacterium]